LVISACLLSLFRTLLCPRVSVPPFLHARDLKGIFFPREDVFFLVCWPHTSPRSAAPFFPLPGFFFRIFLQDPKKRGFSYGEAPLSPAFYFPDPCFFTPPPHLLFVDGLRGPFSCRRGEGKFVLRFPRPQLEPLSDSPRDIFSH